MTITEEMKNGLRIIDLRRHSKKAYKENIEINYVQ